MSIRTTILRLIEIKDSSYEITTKFFCNGFYNYLKTLVTYLCRVSPDSIFVECGHIHNIRKYHVMIRDYVIRASHPYYTGGVYWRCGVLRSVVIKISKLYSEYNDPRSTLQEYLTTLYFLILTSLRASTMPKGISISIFAKLVRAWRLNNIII